MLIFFIETCASCTALGPVAHVVDAFFHLIGEWNDFVAAADDAVGIDIAFCLVGIEQCRDDGLFDFGTGESLCCRDDSWNIEVGNLTLFLDEVNFDNGLSLGGAWKIDEEDFIETAFTEKFGGQH